MHDKIKSDYHRLRREYPANTALAIARNKQAERDYPFAGYDDETFETDDGFTVRMNVEPEYEPIDTFTGDCYGGFETAPHEYSGRRLGVDGVPSSNPRSRWHDDPVWYAPNRHWTFEDRIAQNHKAGMAKNAAYLAAINDLCRESFQYQNILKNGFYWIRITVERDGEEYGEDSIGGVEHGYVIGCAIDHALLDSALEQARKRYSAELTAAARAIEASRPDLYKLA